MRYLRLKKQDVLFVGGSDEHGVPITIRAKRRNHPQDIVDRYHSIIKNHFEDFGISFDIYSRTSSETHHKLASDFSVPCTTKEVVEKTSEINITTKRHISSWPTVTLPVNVRIATPRSLRRSM